jgi:hypothetical protein
MRKVSRRTIMSATAALSPNRFSWGGWLPRLLINLFCLHNTEENSAHPSFAYWDCEFSMVCDVGVKGKVMVNFLTFYPTLRRLSSSFGYNTICLFTICCL